MTVQEVMERTGTTETKLVLAWIRDAIHLIQSTYNENIGTWKTDVTDGQRDYPIPADLIKIMSVSVKDTEAKKYKRIRRLVFQPIMTEDLDPE
jgi:hypothetical protein